MIKMLHMAARGTQVKPGSPFHEALKEFGEVEIREQCREMSDDEALALMRQADVLITNWATRPIPPALAEDPGSVRPARL